MSLRVTIYPDQVIAAARAITTPDRIEVAQQVAADAAATAPVESGEYRGGIGVQVNGDDVSVVDSDPEAFYKEYGTADTPAHATLTDAARRHGRYSGMQPGGR